MPFINRRVEPIFLSNKTLPRGCRTELENVANNTLANLVRQLADIADHATDIFEGISSEALGIYDRSNRLKLRTARVELILAALDAKTVKVPVSTLSDFKTLTEHYRYRTPVQSNLITPASRPPCVQLHYHKASTNLKDIFAKLKEYHEDEVTVSNLCQSISLSRLNCDTDSSEYEFEFPRAPIYETIEQRRRKPLLPYSKLPSRPLSEADLLDDHVTSHRGTLPTPEEVMRKNITQSMVINVDTSGTGFERMQTFRRSLTAMGRKLERAKKKRWRKSIASDDMFPPERHSESADERNAVDDNCYDLKTLSLDRRSFRRVNLKQESQEGLAVVTTIRTRKRPKSLRLLPATINIPGLQHWRDSHAKQEKKNASHTTSSSRNRHSVALPIQSDFTSSPSQGYSSLDDKTWPGPSSGQRPNSLALPPAGSSLAHFPQRYSMNVPVSPAQPINKTVSGLSQQSVPNAVIPTNSITMSIKPRRTSSKNGSGDSQHVHLQDALRRNLPSSKVRLRNAKPLPLKDERQSSSGNWSGTDSARTSMNSDLGTPLVYDFPSSTTTSPSDSAVSLSSENLNFPNKFNNRLIGLDRKHSRKSDRPNSLLYASTGESSSNSSTPTNSPNNVRSGFTQMDADSWLHSVGATTNRRAVPNKPATTDRNSSSSKGTCQVIFTSDALSDTSSNSSENPPSSVGLSDNCSLDLEVYLGDVNSDYIDSDSTSNSVDHEGYWTSMHSDCGLPSRRRIKKPTKSSPTKDQPTWNGNQTGQSTGDQTTSKRSSLAISVTSTSTTKKKPQPPPLPLRIESAVGDDPSSNTAGGRPSLLLFPPNLFEDIRSISPSSLTDTASETSTISSDTTTTPTITPVQTPTDPLLYKLCFGGISKSMESLSDSQGYNRLDALTADPTQSLKQQQFLPETSKQRASAGQIETSSRSTPVPSIQEQASVATFRPQLIQPSSLILPKVSGSHAKSLQTATATPTSTQDSRMKGKCARDIFFGISRADQEENLQIEERADAFEQNMNDDGGPELDSVVSPIGVYPESYRTLKRRTKHDSGEALNKPKIDGHSSLAEGAVLITDIMDDQMEGSTPERLTVGSQARKGLDTLQRKQRNQATQNSIGSNNEPSGLGSGTQAMSREQREEILNMMRKAKNNKTGSSSIPVLESKSKNTSQAHELTKIHENVSSLPVENAVADNKSFRNSYHVSIEADNLDPDLAIIRAAEQMEQQLRQKKQVSHCSLPGSSCLGANNQNVWLPNQSQQPFSRNSIAYQSFYDTEMSGNSFSHVPSMVSDDSYTYDPSRRPKRTILKVRKPSGEVSSNETPNGIKHWSLSPSKRSSLAMSPTDSVTSINSIRSITFSDMVDVEHTPVKICLMSGKPQTPIDDFKMLLEQHSDTKSGQSACSALNVQNKPQRPQSNAELLYTGSRNNGPSQDSSGNIPSRKIVSMKDLRTAMAKPKTNALKAGDLGLPYEKLQAQNKQKTSSTPSTNRQDNKFANGSVKSTPNGTVHGVSYINSGGDPFNVSPISSHAKRPLTSTANSNGPTTKAENQIAMSEPQSTTAPNTTGKHVITSSKGPSVADARSDLLKKPRYHLTESASDSALSSKDLMEDIRRRGSRQDSRLAAVSVLEAQRLEKRLGFSSSMPSLISMSVGGAVHPNAATSGAKLGLGSLLDSMNTALNSMSVTSQSSDGEHERDHDSSAWDE